MSTSDAASRLADRHGAVIVRRGVPLADYRTNLSLIPAAAIGVWLARNRRHIRGRLLDAGCGNKPYAGWYDPLCSASVGVDPAPGNGDATALLERLPFADGTFDTVLVTEVLEHVEDVDASLAELHRVLRRGGRVLATVPFLYPGHEMPHDYRRFTARGFESVFEHAGFRVIEVRSKGGPATVAVHVMSMLAVRSALAVARRVLPSRHLTSSMVLRWLLAAPQRLYVRLARPLDVAVNGRSSEASLGYMLIAERP